MTKLVALLKKEFLVVSKDIHGLLVLFLMPAAFILIMSLATQDVFGTAKSSPIKYAVLDQYQQTLSIALIQKLRDIKGFEAVVMPGDATVVALRESLQRGDYQFALHIPADFAARLAANDEAGKPTTASVELFIAPAQKPYVQQLFSSALQSFLSLAKLTLALNATGKNPLPANPAELEALGRVHVAESYVYGSRSENKAPTSVQQNVPAWLVFSMFFVVIPLSTAFLAEKQHGTLQRLRLMGVGTGPLLLGKLLPYYVINQAQMMVMLVVGRFAVPLLGGDQLNMVDSWLGLLIISSACSFAAIGFALLIATLVKTTMQATTVGGVTNIIFGALGGVMVPKFVMPDFMQRITDVSPMAWGLEGFLDVFLRQGDWQTVLPEAGWLLLFGALSLTAATLFYRRLQ